MAVYLLGDNMKFSNLHDLWNKFENCPICKTVCEVEIQLKIESPIGPIIFNPKIKKSNEDLILNHFSDYNPLSELSFLIKINCLTNELVFNASSKFIELAKDGFMSIHWECQDHNKAHFYTDDIFVDFKLNQIKNFEIKRSSFYLSNKDEIYKIDLFPKCNGMTVVKSYFKDNTLISSELPLRYPIIDIDFSDQNSAIKRIKNLMAFN